MNKTIIVPTDFSQNAEMACWYACQLAHIRGYNIHLLHCYTVTSVGSNDPETADKEPTILADTQIQQLQEMLLNDYSDLRITSDCTRGLIIDKLSELSNADECVLIIMGASGASQSKSLYWGSTTIAAASKSSVPVIVVPNKRFTFDVNKVALLTNFKAAELDTLREFRALLGTPQQITIVHVFKEDQRSGITDTIESWAYNIREMGSVDSVNAMAEPIHEDDEQLDTIPEVVSKAIDELDPSLILITPSRKTFFQRLFRPSVSKAIALELQKPAFFDKI